MEIIDGQQRLTTFQIILCAIRDICNEFDEDPMEIQKNINNYMYLTPLKALNDGPYKLLPREGMDREVFLFLCGKEHAEVEKGSLIWQAYVYFKNAIKEFVNNDYNRLHTLRESIMVDFRVVTIKVTSEDEYAKIFKSINGTGRRLEQFDLIRNDFFLRASIVKRDKLYKTYWQHFEEDPDWRERRVDVDDFLEDFLKIKLGEDFDEKFSLFDLYGLYCAKLVKELNLSEKDPQLVEYEFYDLSRYSHIYHDIHTPNSGEIGNCIKFYNEFKDKLEFKDKPNVNVVKQLKLFILYISNEFGLSTRELNCIFNLFESYIVRGILYLGSKGYNSPSLRKLNNLFLRALDRKKSLSIVALVHLLSNEFISDQEVESVFNTGRQQRLPATEQTRKHSSSNLMREFGGRYIFSVLGWSIDKNELFEKFCEKWPSAEVILQKELIGDLPIVYSKVPVSVKND